jgi:hypothetical protein
VLTALAMGTLSLLDTAKSAFDLMLSIGAGTGLLYILRWFWWRVNPWSEITAMVASFVVAVSLLVARTTELGILTTIAQSGTWSLLVSVAVTTVVWVVATFATTPTRRRAPHRLLSKGDARRSRMDAYPRAGGRPSLAGQPRHDDSRLDVGGRPRLCGSFRCGIRPLRTFLRSLGLRGDLRDRRIRNDPRTPIDARRGSRLVKSFSTLRVVAMTFFAACSASSSESPPMVVDLPTPPHGLVPKPASYEERPGSLILGPVMRIGAGDGAATARDVLLAGLAADGWRAEADPRQGHLMLALAPESKERFGDEGYLLEIGEKRADLVAATSVGLRARRRHRAPTRRRRYGRQVLGRAASKTVRDSRGAACCSTSVVISCRRTGAEARARFDGVPQAERLPLALTEDQGWRIEIREVSAPHRSRCVARLARRQGKGPLRRLLYAGRHPRGRGVRGRARHHGGS